MFLILNNIKQLQWYRILTMSNSFGIVTSIKIGNDTEDINYFIYIWIHYVFNIYL